MNCVVCGNAEGLRELSPDLCSVDNRLCPRCGLVFIPRATGEKHDYYRQGGYYTQSPNIAARSLLTSRHLLLSQARERVARMDALLPFKLENKRVLDVGCGYGEILGYLRSQRGCDVLGLEPSTRTAAAGGELFGLRIVPSLVEDHAFGSEQFDLVVCNHTLEHVDDPARFLRLLKPLIAKGGALYLEVPNILWPSGGFTLEAFLYHEHLQTFSAWNLYLLLRAGGLRVHAYSDRDFLRFVCVPDDAAKGVEVPPIDAARIESFLRDYKAGYSLAQHARVSIGKAAYLLRLSYSKMIDILHRP